MDTNTTDPPVDDSTTVAAVTTTPIPKTPAQRKPRKPKTNNNLYPHLLSLLSSTTNTTRSFLSQNDLHLLPSQTLFIESLLSSLPLPPSPSLSPPPSSSFYQRFIASSDEVSDDPRWLLFFRMSKPTFEDLLTLLTPHLSPSLPPNITPHCAMAASLYRLAHGASYKTVAERFGLDSYNAACLCFYAFCKAVCDKLGSLIEYRTDMERIALGFGWHSLPNCCGVLGFGRFGFDGDLFGKNGFLLVQALVDFEGRFLDISAGWPSSMKPEVILKESKLYKEVSELLKGESYELGDGDVISQYFLGESCFPLLSWLITPYVRPGEEDSFSAAEREFNRVHRGAMGLVSTAFRRVRSRWQLLAKNWREKTLEFYPFVILMGCLLHNFLIKCGEPLPSDSVGYHEQLELPVFEGGGDEDGSVIRDLLAAHLCQMTLMK